MAKLQYSGLSCIVLGPLLTLSEWQHSVIQGVRLEKGVVNLAWRAKGIIQAKVGKALSGVPSHYLRTGFEPGCLRGTPWLFCSEGPSLGGS